MPGWLTWSHRASWFCLLAGIVLSLLTGLDERLPFLISAVIVGLPHGAADWLILGRGGKGRLISFVVFTPAHHVLVEKELGRL